MFGRTCSSIAVDIGAAGVRICQLLRSGGRVRVHRLRELAGQLGASPDRASARALGGERVRRIVAQAGCSGVAASVALSPPEVNLQLVTAPAEMFSATTSEWNTLLRFEAARQLQVEPDGLEIAAWPLPKQNGGPTVISAAIPRTTVQSYRDCFAGLGLELGRIDVLPLALMRAAWRAGVPGQSQQSADALWGILELGVHSSCLAIAVGSQCVFVRNLNIAGDAFTNALMESCELSYAAAETLKHDPAASVLEQPARTDDSPTQQHPLVMVDQLTGVQTALRSKTRLLTAEVRRAFTFALENYADTMPVGLYLCGGSARLAGLAEHMAESLGVVVQVLTPVKCLGAGATEKADDPLLHDPANVAVVGLALGDAP